MFGGARAPPLPLSPSFPFVLQVVFLDDSAGGNNTLRKLEHWLGGAKSGTSQAYKQAFTVNRVPVLKRMSDCLH